MYIGESHTHYFCYIRKFCESIRIVVFVFYIFLLISFSEKNYLAGKHQFTRANVRHSVRRNVLHH